MFLWSLCWGVGGGVLWLDKENSCVHLVSKRCIFPTSPWVDFPFGSVFTFSSPSALFLRLLLPSTVTFAPSLSFVQCQVLVFGGSLSPDGPLWSFIDDSRTEEGLPSCCCLAPCSVCPHTHTHTQPYSHNDSRTCSYWNRLTPRRTLRSTQTKKFPLFIFLRRHTSLRCSLLLSGVILCCTFAPSPSFHHPLSASSSPSFTSCCGVTDSVTQEQTEGETEGGKGNECESCRGDV